jgi:hypothetical protein
MSRPLIASKLIKSVRDRALIPTDSSTYQDEDILNILNEEVTQGLLSTIMSLNEEHMVTHEDVPSTSTLASVGVKIPERAVGNKLRDIAYLRGNNFYEVSRISLEELSDYRNNQEDYNIDLCYVEGDSVKFVSNELNADNIRMYFYMTPNEIVNEDECGKVFSIVDNGDTTTTLTLVDFPDNFTNLPIMDIVSNKVPNKILNYNIVPISVNRNSKIVTLNTADIPTNLSVGDYVCEQFTSPFLNMPSEMHPLLAQRAAVFILEALGDTEGLRNAMMRLEKMETSIQTILEDRVEGAPQKINPRHSPLKQTFWVGTKGRRKGRF